MARSLYTNGRPTLMSSFSCRHCWITSSAIQSVKLPRLTSAWLYSGQLMTLYDFLDDFFVRLVVVFACFAMFLPPWMRKRVMVTISHTEKMAICLHFFKKLFDKTGIERNIFTVFAFGHCPESGWSKSSEKVG